LPSELTSFIFKYLTNNTIIKTSTSQIFYGFIPDESKTECQKMIEKCQNRVRLKSKINIILLYFYIFYLSNIYECKQNKKETKKKGNHTEKEIIIPLLHHNKENISFPCINKIEEENNVNNKEKIEPFTEAIENYLNVKEEIHSYEENAFALYPFIKKIMTMENVFHIKNKTIIKLIKIIILMMHPIIQMIFIPIFK